MRMVYNYCLEDIKTIAVDFDGTLCEREKFPVIGKPKTELIQWLEQQHDKAKKSFFGRVERVKLLGKLLNGVKYRDRNLIP